MAILEVEDEFNEKMDQERFQKKFQFKILSQNSVYFVKKIHANIWDVNKDISRLKQHF